MIYPVSPTPHSFYFHLCHLISLSASILKTHRIMYRKQLRSIKAARGNKPFTPISWNLNYTTKAFITCLHLHLRWSAHKQLVHTQKELYAQTETLNEVIADSDVVHNIDPLIYSSLSSCKAIDKIIPYAGIGHCQIAKMGLLYLKRVP